MQHCGSPTRFNDLKRDDNRLSRSHLITLHNGLTK